MAEVFSGRWRLSVAGKNASADQRVRVTGADSGGGIYPGLPGTTFDVSGNHWAVALEWNDGAGAGWQESAVLRSVGSLSPLVILHILSAGNDVPAEPAAVFDDLVVRCEDLDPIFDVVQRPFALDRGSLTMMPDGIFDTSQSIQYIGVRIRNTWEFDWVPSTGVKLGIPAGSRTDLGSAGIRVLDDWSGAEQGALQQEMDGGFVCVPSLGVGEERVIYFKVDVSNAAPGKPSIRLVAQSNSWDPAYDQLTRQVGTQIFISRSTYDPTERELVAEIPEGTVYMRLNTVIADLGAMAQSVDQALRAPQQRDPPKPGGAGSADGAHLGVIGGSAGRGEEPGVGGLGDGPGGDDWCRYPPFHWLPVEFEYRIVPGRPFAGQFGPLAFGDPWWKVLLMNLGALQAAASLVYDDVTTAEATRPGSILRNAEITGRLDGCDGTQVVSVDAPDRLGGSVTASAGVTAAIGAALSDEIDPTREGQEVTVPPDGALTLEEYTRVRLDYSEFPRPGVPFELRAAWEYERRTDSGTITHADARQRQNPHTLLFHRLFTDRHRYTPDGMIRLFGVVIPPVDQDQRQRDCDAYHCVALLHPRSLDRSYPVILRSVAELPDGEHHHAILWDLLRERELPDKERETLQRYQHQICLYYGEHPTAGLPVGASDHWMHVQTVNTVRPGTNPLIAAQTIGGLPVSNHYRGTPDSPCGPFRFNIDGSFTIQPARS